MAAYVSEYLTTFWSNTYHKRARDSNVGAPPPPACFVYWQTTDPAGAYPLPPPFGGPLVEETILFKTTT